MLNLKVYYTVISLYLSKCTDLDLTACYTCKMKQVSFWKLIILFLRLSFYLFSLLLKRLLSTNDSEIAMLITVIIRDIFTTILYYNIVVNISRSLFTAFIDILDDAVAS